MRHAVTSQRLLRTALFAGVAVLAACGSSRKQDGGETATCFTCHGTAGVNAAPPAAVTNSADRSTGNPGVGAHQAHLVAGTLRGPIACSECHVVPTDTAHSTGAATASLTWGPLATTGGLVPSYDSTSHRCSSTYCHGASMADFVYLPTARTTPLWTGGPAEAACGTCHGNPPPSHRSPTPNGASPDWAQCSDCHAGTVKPDGTIDVAGGLHMNGLVEDATGGNCGNCHDSPPPTGGHGVHVITHNGKYGSTAFSQQNNPAATPPYTDYVSYNYYCGNCHPLDRVRHMNDRIDVELSPVGAPAGSIKVLHGVAAAYTPGMAPNDGTCSSVYCHSSGQATPAFVTTPSWSSGVSLGCTGCHANPPAYASGGAGTETANGHLGLLSEGGKTYETGHFGGFPAALHEGSSHGVGPTTSPTPTGIDSSPITCQACHFYTMDAGNVAPSGFYYLDTTGNYDLGGTGDFAIKGSTVPAYSCTGCHTGTPAAGSGSVVTYLHVNGVRDVTFDQRTSLPGTTPGLPAAPDTPTRPYWFTSKHATPSSMFVDAQNSVGTSGGLDGTQTLSFELTGATWDPAQKSCSSVPCHFNRANRPAIRWGEPLGAGGPPLGTCGVCHNY